MSELSYVQFTEEMRKDYTVLMPNMLPMHFRMIGKVFNSYGIKSNTIKKQYYYELQFRATQTGIGLETF